MQFANSGEQLGCGLLFSDWSEKL